MRAPLRPEDRGRTIQRRRNYTYLTAVAEDPRTVSEYEANVERKLVRPTSDPATDRGMK